MISMKDLARQCNVSVATISKALNDQSDISEATKKKVREVAEEMGYFPNAAARLLKTNKSYNLGVLFVDEANSGLTHEYFAAVLEGFKVEAENQGYDLTFINGRVGNKTVSYYEHCRYRNLDGVVIACVDFSNPDVLELMNSDFPVVTIDHIHENCTSILSDNVSGMQNLLNYIGENGHRRIAYIHGEEASAVTKARRTSYFRFMEEHDLPVYKGYVQKSKYLNAKQAGLLTKEMLELKEPPTCILYPDDISLIGGINEIRRKKLKIAQDVSIAGYDGTKVSRVISPRLTTIRQDTFEIGKRAAIELVKTIEKPKTTFVERILIEGTLQTGKSVGMVKDLF